MLLYVFGYNSIVGNVGGMMLGIGFMFVCLIVVVFVLNDKCEFNVVLDEFILGKWCLF